MQSHASLIVFFVAFVAGLFIVAIFHRRRKILVAGTVPNNVPPETVYQIGQTAVGNKLGNTGAFSTTIFFTAPTPGWNQLGWAVHINSTDAAGSITHDDGKIPAEQRGHSRRTGGPGHAERRQRTHGRLLPVRRRNSDGSRGRVGFDRHEFRRVRVRYPIILTSHDS